MLPKPSAGDRSSKPKSRFALQREKEAAEQLASSSRSGTGSERFTLDLDEIETAAAASNPRLVGEVVERDISPLGAAPPLPPSRTAAPFKGSPIAERRPTGFPLSSQLRPDDHIKTSFNQTSRSNTEFVQQSALPGLMSMVSEENDRTISGMSNEDIQEEQRSIRELGLPAGVLKMLETRRRDKAVANLSGGPSQARVTKKVVRIQEPSSQLVEEEEGSPEYIRRHFFPNEPPSSENISLQWMRQPSSSTSTATSASTSNASLTTLFDLQGILLPPSSSPPPVTDNATSNNKHHATSSSSTFTVPTLLSLVTSTVSAQRSTAFKILAHILLRPEQAEAFGRNEWEKLRVEAVRSAGWGIRDGNLGVRRSAMDLLAIVFAEEKGSSRTKAKNLKAREVAVEGKEVQEDIVTTFLATDPFPIFARHLQLGSLPRQSLLSIVSILSDIVLSSVGGPKSLAVEELVACKGLLEALSKRLIAVPWPMSESDMDREDDMASSLPYYPAITLLTLLAKSSKARARSIWDRTLVDTPLRFFSTLPWELDSGNLPIIALSYRLLEETIELWTVLSRYGIGASIRTNGASLFVALFVRFASLFDDTSIVVDKDELRLVEKWFELMTAWTTAAIDPHSTNHDITWTQVEEWSELLVSTHSKLILRGRREEREILVVVWECLSAWMEGSKMNKPWRGETERIWLLEKIGEDFEKGGRALEKVHRMVARMGTTRAIQEDDLIDCRLILAANRLSNAYEDDSIPVTPFLFVFDPVDLPIALDSLLVILIRNDEAAITTNWPVISMVVSLLPHLTFQARLASSFAILPLLRAGDEGPARELSDWILSNVRRDDVLAIVDSISPELEGLPLKMATILRPFILHAINTANGGKLVAPYRSYSRDLFNSTSQRPFNTSAALLEADWPVFALNELLRSGTSPVFDNLPPKWDSSELEIVRSSLALMHVAEGCTRRISPSTLIYDMIKVFMLEKDNSEKVVVTEKSDVDLFRDNAVNYSMTQLLQPLSLAAQSTQLLRRSFPLSPITSVSNLETVSALYSSAPFYSLYTDLIGLFDSISLSHPNFAAMLLPTLAKTYPLDYRKLLWIDYSHLLRSINLTISQAITDSPGSSALSQYLYPTETNDDLLAAYAEALVVNKVVEGSYLYFIAMVHIVETLFQSNDNELGGVEDSLLVKRLSKSFIAQGSDQLILRLLSVRLAEEEGDQLLLIPECFVGSPRVDRMLLIERRLAGDDKLIEKFGEWKIRNGI